MEAVEFIRTIQNNCDKSRIACVADAHIGLRRLRNDSTFMVCPDYCDCGDCPKFGLQVEIEK